MESRNDVICVCIESERDGEEGDDGGVAMVVHKDKLSAYIWADINLKNV